MSAAAAAAVSHVFRSAGQIGRIVAAGGKKEEKRAAGLTDKLTIF